MNKLQRKFRDGVKEIFDELMARTEIPGLAVGVVRDGALLEVIVAGTTARDGDAIHESTRFRIASMTKSFAAAAMFRLRDQGTIRLSNTVSHYFSDNDLSPRLAQLTIEQLLTMTADLPTDDPWGDRWLGASDTAYEKLFRLEYAHAHLGPSTCSYSNLGYILLGRILSRASGMEAKEYINEHLLKPLGMNDTVWNRDGESGTFALPHQHRGGGVKPMSTPVCRGDGDVFAGLWSNLQDLAIWIDFLSDAFQGNSSGRYDAILAAESRREMQSEKSLMPDSFLMKYPCLSMERVRSRYGYGLRIFECGGVRTIGHSGGLPGYGSHMRWHESTGLGIVALSNITYAPVTTPAAVALDFLICHGAAETKDQTSPRSESAVFNHFEMLKDCLKALGSPPPSEHFSHNFFLDNDALEFQNRWAELQQLLLGRVDQAELLEISSHKGELRWVSHPQVTLQILLSPEIPSRIQKLDIHILKTGTELIQRSLSQLAKCFNWNELQIPLQSESEDLLLEQVCQELLRHLGSPTSLCSLDSVEESLCHLHLSGPRGRCQLTLFDDEQGLRISLA